MNCFVLLPILLCFFQHSKQTMTGLSNGDATQGINKVELDFHGKASTANTSSALAQEDIRSVWMWRPMGDERNKVEFEPVLSHFKFDTGSGDGEDTGTQNQESWSQTETIEIKLNQTKNSSLKTIDKNRNETEEKAYLIYAEKLEKTNWCFKDTEASNMKTKFKITKKCCERRRECRSTRHVKRGLHDCSCDIYFHICLKAASTKTAKSIEKMYFQQNTVCYRRRRKDCAQKACDVTYRWKIIPYHL